MEDDGYRFELTNPHKFHELERISGLLRTVFSKARQLTPAYLSWLYRDNPDGEGVGCNAWWGDELVGHMATMALTGRVEGEPRPGLFIVNGAVAAAHRRRRLQSRISAAIFEEGERRGFTFCFSTGNRYSTVPLLTRFRMLRPLEVRIGVGVPARREMAVRASFERQWSEEALRWRLANPEKRYVVREAEAAGSTILAASGYPGVSALLASGAAFRRLQASGKSPGPLRVWLGLDPSIDWRRSAYVPIPRALRPSPLNLVFRDLTGRGFLPDPERLVFHGIDCDAY